MTEQNRGVTFELRKIYLKDVSFESPMAPQVFTKEQQPSIDVQLRMEHKLIDEVNGFYESVLSVTVTAKEDADTIFICEVQQAGIFQITNVSGDELDIALEVACPNSLFPYAREAISELVGKGGFPQLLVNPINFESLYHHKRREQQAAQNAAGSQTAH